MTLIVYHYKICIFFTSTCIYYYAKDGILNIRNIDIPAYSNYKTIEIVTQDRLAYKSQRNTTTTIRIL
ncbi:MAG: hypothetical protein IJJ47_11520 [Methanosphaera sp.]|nr:hypothetical protein [Methanosphaera sp.]